MLHRLIVFLGIFFNFALANTFEPFNKETLHYLEQMPWHLYELHTVPKLGRFWIDEIDEREKETLREGKIWKSYLIDRMKKYIKKGDRVIDVGAGIGTFSLAMGKMVGPQGKVYAFEGMKQKFRELYYTAHANPEIPILPLFYDLKNVSKNLKESPPKHFENSLVFLEDASHWEKKIRTLDSFELKKIAVINVQLDQEEELFLKGAFNTIKESRPFIFIEVLRGCSNSPLVEAKKHLSEILSSIKNLNYSIKKLMKDDYLGIPEEKLELFK